VYLLNALAQMPKAGTRRSLLSDRLSWRTMPNHGVKLPDNAGERCFISLLPILSKGRLNNEKVRGPVIHHSVTG